MSSNPVSNRIKIEKAIVKCLMNELADHGFAMAVHDGEGWAGPITQHPDIAFNTAFSTDEDTLCLFVRENVLEGSVQELKDFFTSKKAEHPDKKSFQFSSVQLIYGNDGHDVIADYGMKIEKYIEKTNALAEAIECGAGITPKMKEEVVLETFFNEMADHGFTMRVHEGEDWAGPATKNAKTAMSMTRSTDQDRIYLYVRESDLDHVSQELKDFFAKHKSVRPDKAIFLFSTASMVYGNDGHDVIADHGTNLEPFLKKTEAVIEAIEDGTYDFNIDYDKLAEQSLKKTEPNKTVEFDGPSM